MVKKYDRMFNLTIHQNTTNIKWKGGTSQQVGENEKDDKYLSNVYVSLGTQTSVHYSWKYILM